MNPYLKGAQAYKQASVNTYDQGALIIMLYEGAIRFLKQSLIKLEKNDLEGTHECLIRSKAIISELLLSLNTEGTGEVGRGLQQLYNYMYNRLIEANINKKPEIISEVIKLLSNLLEGWKAVAKNGKKILAAESEKLSAGRSKPTSIQG